MCVVCTMMNIYATTHKHANVSACLCYVRLPSVGREKKSGVCGLRVLLCVRFVTEKSERTRNANAPYDRTIGRKREHL